MSSSIINRRLEPQEISYVVAALNDDELITLLTAVKDNPVAAGEPDVDAGENAALIGWSRETVVATGTDEEIERKKGVLAKMVDIGLIEKGGYIPIDTAQINGYKLTEAGRILWTGVPPVLPELGRTTTAATKKNTEEKKQEPQPQPQQQQQQQKKVIGAAAAAEDQTKKRFSKGRNVNIKY